MYYFSLVDYDFENIGILETNLSKEIIDIEWSHYFIAENSDHCIEEFIELLREAYPANHFNRFFLDSIIDPTIDPSYWVKRKTNLNLEKQ